MKAVEIMRRRPDSAETEVLVRVFVPIADGPAVIAAVRPGGSPGVSAMLAEGVPGPTGELLHLADGAAFVAALPAAYRGSRLWAEEVEP
jgi:hypothetical protein